MSLTNSKASPLQHADRFFIGGEWVAPSSRRHHRRHRLGHRGARSSAWRRRRRPTWRGPLRRPARPSTRVLGRGCPTPSGPSTSGRSAHGSGGTGRRDRADLAPRVRGAPPRSPQYAAGGAAGAFDYYAGLADTFPFEEQRPSPRMAAASDCWSANRSAWSGPSSRGTDRSALIAYKVAPALIAGCTVVLKSSPEAPGEGYLVAEVAESDRPAARRPQRRHRRSGGLRAAGPRPRVDKITFTGSTAAGRRIASLCGERIARCTLELGGKSAAVILDDVDLGRRRRDIWPKPSAC